ncbi:hypothetical protein G7054_g4271 [Neopestalotiopsis clavispora]|nr:hypothetical protein G7054_g4271 [Neopestalotiopsis clavispora]
MPDIIRRVNKLRGFPQRDDPKFNFTNHEQYEEYYASERGQAELKPYTAQPAKSLDYAEYRRCQRHLPTMSNLSHLYDMDDNGFLELDDNGELISSSGVDLDTIHSSLLPPQGLGVYACGLSSVLIVGSKGRDVIKLDLDRFIEE